jgi:transcriptional regulator with PAS, ATPase and Fis domain
MLLGESGTGKALLGNERGAFTGAVAERLGPEGKFRDARVLLKGRLEFKRPQPQ